MAHPAYIQKTLVMKPEVTKVFDDLEDLLDFCRFELLPFNPADLYNDQSKTWKAYKASKKYRRPRKMQ